MLYLQSEAEGGDVSPEFPGYQLSEFELSSVKVDHSILINQILTVPHRHVQKLSYSVSLDPLKLTIKSKKSACLFHVDC